MNAPKNKLILQLLGLIVVSSVVFINFNALAQTEPTPPPTEIPKSTYPDLRIVKIQTADSRHLTFKSSLEYVMVANVGQEQVAINQLRLDIQSANSGALVSVTPASEALLGPNQKLFFINKRVTELANLTPPDSIIAFYQPALTSQLVMTIGTTVADKLINSRLAVQLYHNNQLVDQLSGVDGLPWAIKTSSEVLARQVNEAGDLVEPASYQELLARDLAADELPVLCGPSLIKIDNQCIECTDNEEVVDNQCLPCEGDERLIDGRCVLDCLDDQEPLNGRCADKCQPNFSRDAAGGCQPICRADQELINSKCLPKCLSSYKRDGEKCVPDCKLGYEIGFTGTCVLQCQAGYQRHPETNRCRQIAVTSGSSQTQPKPTACAAGYEIGFTGTCVTKCQPGYVRNPTTNRCRKPATEFCQVGYELNDAGNCVKECQLGYYRNPETGRCRKLEINGCQLGYEKGFTGTCVKECEDGYARSPETNRCQKINASQCKDGYEKGFTGSCVKKCEDGYERSQETNRCRKVVYQATDQDIDNMVGAVKGSNKEAVELQLSTGQTVVALLTAGGALGVSKFRAIKKSLFG